MCLQPLAVDHRGVAPQRMPERQGSLSVTPQVAMPCQVAAIVRLLGTSGQLHLHLCTQIYGRTDISKQRLGDAGPTYARMSAVDMNLS